MFFLRLFSSFLDVPIYETQATLSILVYFAYGTECCIHVNVVYWRECCTIFLLTQFHCHHMLMRPNRDDCRSMCSTQLILHFFFLALAPSFLFLKKHQTSNCCIIPFCSLWLYFPICLCQSVVICFIWKFLSLKLFKALIKSSFSMLFEFPASVTSVRDIKTMVFVAWSRIE